MENQQAVVAHYVANTRPETNKVSCGFKISPALKLKLVNSAGEAKLSFSEYIELITSNFENWKPNAERLTQLEKKAAFYENKILKDLFKKHEGQTIDFITGDNCPMSVKIISIEDAYTVLIHSFIPRSND